LFADIYKFCFCTNKLIVIFFAILELVNDDRFLIRNLRVKKTLGYRKNYFKNWNVSAQ